MSDTLVVYYSRTGKTRQIAEKLAELLSADCDEIAESKDRSGPLGFVIAGKDTLLKKPADLTKSPEPGAHAVVVIGMPVWASQPPPAIRTWLNRVDLHGKTVCVFATSDGGSAKGTFAATNGLLPEPAAETLHCVRPKPNDAELQQTLRNWAEKIRALRPPAA